MKRGQRHIPTQVVGDRGFERLGPSADPHQLLGRVVGGRYRVVRGLAGGSMGYVYEAVQEPFDRRVALKVLSSPGDHRFEKRFRREASTAAQLAHPNIVTIYDYGETDDGQVFMVMAYLDGRPLDRALREDGAFSVRRALGVAIQIARALRKAHDRGVVHRDLKPSNIMLLPSEDDVDFVKVLDFGLVKLFEAEDLERRAPSVYGERLTTVGATLGTPGYMSPEQAMGESIDARTDVYAFGVILYELLAGRLPFQAETLPELISQQVMRPVPPVSTVASGGAIPAEVEELLKASLHRDREARPPTAEALLVRLKSVWRFETDESYGTEVSLASPLGAARVLGAPSMPAEVCEQASGVPASTEVGLGRRGRRARMLVAAALVGVAALVATSEGLRRRGGGAVEAPRAPVGGHPSGRERSVDLRRAPGRGDPSRGAPAVEARRAPGGQDGARASGPTEVDRGTPSTSSSRRQDGARASGPTEVGRATPATSSSWRQAGARASGPTGERVRSGRGGGPELEVSAKGGLAPAGAGPRAPAPVEAPQPRGDAETGYKANPY